ncbi:MAG: LacI family transcriptional regulator [Clostridiales bacterium]|jgi:DNA-binding LacI/PurR family transcriptional regulator|nr:LacI family transcriptional regulator [Clostridiales bacterium]
MTKKTASSRDVAREAGVSQATVSYVLNNVPGAKIRPETREAVLAAAKKMNYHPNIMARSMKMNKVYSIGVVSNKGLSSYAFMSVMDGIKDLLSQHNYSLTICSNRYDNFENAEFIQYYNSKRIDGIIFAYANLTDGEIEFLFSNRIPFFAVHPAPESESAHIVKTSMRSAMLETIKHLRERTNAPVTYIGQRAGDLNFSRYRAFYEAHQELGAQSQLPCEPLRENSQAETWLERNFPRGNGLPAAIMCERASLGCRLLRFCARWGLKVPENHGIAAMGNSQFADISYPALSAMEAPLREMGRQAADMLLHMINGVEFQDVIVLEWNFVRRESC